jgi:uncharacterized membrane protein
LSIFLITTTKTCAEGLVLDVRGHEPFQEVNVIRSTEQRPNKDIPKTTSERLGDMLGYTFFLSSVLLSIFVWPTLPDQVPAHYNAFGEVTRWGSKAELIPLPLIGSILLLVMQGLEKYPELHNYPKRLNEANATSFYLQSRQMLNQIKNVCLMALAFIMVTSVATTLGWWHGLGGWFLPVLLIGVFLPIVIGLIRRRRIA